MSAASGLAEASTWAELEARKDEIRRKDPATYQTIQEEDAAVLEAYNKLQGDWQMAEFFEDMSKDKDKWFQKYKDEQYRPLMNKLYKAAGVRGEELYSGPCGYPETLREATIKKLKGPMGLNHGPLPSKISALAEKVSEVNPVKLQMTPVEQSDSKFTSSTVMYQKPDPNMLARAAATMMTDTKAITTNIQLTGWMFFSAFPVSSGNVGQANYCAGNALLHSPTNIMRTTRGCSMLAACIQWGAVGAIGMRWKAFASQDFLNNVEGALFTLQDSAMILKQTVAMTSIDTPDYVSVFLFDPASRSAIVAPPQPGTYAKLGAITAGRGSDMREAKPDKGIMTPGIMSFQDPANRTVEVSSSQMLVGGAPDIGKQVKLARMRMTPEFNGLKGEITDDLGDGRWLVKLDDTLVEELVQTGYVKPPEKKSITVDDAPAHKMVADGQDPFTIAGTWDDYLPHQMDWDNDAGCYKFWVQLGARGASFYVVRGRAGSKKLKYKGKTWTINKTQVEAGGPAWYEIRLFVKDLGVIKKVDWTKAVDPPDGTMAMLTASEVAE